MKKIFLDCDPGHDDMIAIMMACESCELELTGITTVAGNQTGDKTFQNALKVLTLINERNIPAARGSDKPLIRELITAPSIHGKSGLDGAELPEPDIKPAGIDAMDLLVKTLRESEQKITLVPTGPLTNIALLFLKDPGIKEKIERIVLMGGAIYDSNITPAAEFNIYVDPEAAGIVFESGLPITMVGLDVTNKALITFEQIDELINRNGKISSVVGLLLKFFAQANRDFFGINGAPVHDALAVASIINPDVIKTENLHVGIETRGTLTRGRTVADVHRITGKEPNAEVALEVNTKIFIKMMMDSIKALDNR